MSEWGGGKSAAFAAICLAGREWRRRQIVLISAAAARQKRPGMRARRP